MLSKTFFEEISWPIVELYVKCENRLLSQIIKQAKKGADFSGKKLEWDMRKLNDLGGLTKGAVKTIAQTSKQANVLLNRILLEVAKKAIAESGYTEPSQGVFRVVQALQSQAKSTLNIVNTTMLAGTQDSFGELVAVLNNERNKILNQSAVDLVTGTKTFQQNVAHTIKELSDNGINAFRDKAGRDWSPEGYVSMDMRTTSAKVAREAVQAQANDFNMNVFQVSSHAGARPKCAPYQGRFYSDNGTSGVIEDAHGNKYEYEPIERTSYGEPDGLFGINCGHDRIYVSEGFYNRREPLTAEQLEENRKTYERSQQQRAIERDIRKYQREADNLKEAGYKNFSDIAEGKARQARDEYRSFCNETGRTPRWDRTRVY